MADLATLKATVYGRVQGVFFRSFVAREAVKLQLTGYVQNLRDGSLTVYAEGDRGNLKQLLKALQVGPPEAMVERVETDWSEFDGMYAKFTMK